MGLCVRQPEDDTALIEACIKKDAGAWSALVKKYSPLIKISIEIRLKKYGFSVPSHEIEDIRQDILADIWENNKLGSVLNRSDISYWLAILSGNAAISHYRVKNKRQAEKNMSISDKIGEKELSEFLASDNINSRDEMARAEMEVKMDEMIESLPEKERLMVKLYAIHNRKYADIADIMCVPVGTVSNYINRAREKIKKAFKGY